MSKKLKIIFMVTWCITPKKNPKRVHSVHSRVQTQEHDVNFGSDASCRLSNGVLVIFRLVPNDLNCFWHSNHFSWLSFFKFYSFSVSDDIFDFKLLLGICIDAQFYAQVILNDIFYVVWSISQHHLLADSSCMMCRKNYGPIIGLILVFFKERIVFTSLLLLCYASLWLCVTWKWFEMQYWYLLMNINSFGDSIYAW